MFFILCLFRPQADINLCFFFIVYELACILGNDSGIVSFIHSYQLRVFTLFDLSHKPQFTLRCGMAYRCLSQEPLSESERNIQSLILNSHLRFHYPQFRFGRTSTKSFITPCIEEFFRRLIKSKEYEHEKILIEKEKKCVVNILIL